MLPLWRQRPGADTSCRVRCAEILSADCVMCGDTEAIDLNGNGADALAGTSSRVVMKSQPPDATP